MGGKKGESCMRGFFVPNKSTDERTEVWTGNQVHILDHIDGRGILGELAPFSLNPIQRCFFEYYKKGGAVIATPTGSGKTVIAYLSIFRGDQPKKTIYITATRALARQVFQDLKGTQLRIFLRTGENKMEVRSNYQMVVATPEAFLAARHSGASWVEEAELVVLDEAHMVVQDRRGIVYEEVIIHTVADLKELLILSATMPDAVEMARWSRSSLLIESDWRPVPLIRSFERYPLPTEKNGLKALKQVLDGFLLENIHQGVKSMIIVPSKKVGWVLLESFERLGLKALNETVPYIKPELDSAPAVAFHNADIPLEEKEAIETHFKKTQGGIQVLIATQTLAYGFNSPADDILIYVKYAARDPDLLWPKFIDLLQFEGRAGRKGFTKRGEGKVIYTTGQTGDKTMQVLQQKLKQGLGDHLETALDRSFASLDSRFMGFAAQRFLGDIELICLGLISVDKKRLKLIHYQGASREPLIQTAIRRLHEIGMVDEHDNLTPLGQLTASYMFNPETVASFSRALEQTRGSEQSNLNIWDLWRNMPFLIPNSAYIPDFYPPYIPMLPGDWHPHQLASDDTLNGMFQHGLGVLHMKAGVGIMKRKHELRRQKAPAWSATLYNDTQLAMSFYKQGVSSGFWDGLGALEAERVWRSYAYGVHPYFSLLTRIPQIGSVRGNLMSWSAIAMGIHSDVELLRVILKEPDAHLSLYQSLKDQLRPWYQAQLIWLKKNQGISGSVDTKFQMELDLRILMEGVEIIRQQESLYDMLLMDTPRMQTRESLPEWIRTRFEKALCLFCPKKESAMMSNQFLDMEIMSEKGTLLGRGVYYEQGMMPPRSVISMMPSDLPFLVTDGTRFCWNDSED